MLSRDIAMYSKLRYEIRAYMNFIFEQNIKNYMPNMSINQVRNGMIRIHNEIKMFNALYILDENGILLDGISNKKQIDEFVDSDCLNRSNYYESIKERRIVITDPYPSKIGGKLVVTASYPVYDNKNKLICIACIDILLEDALSLSLSPALYSYFSKFSMFIYAILSALLSIVALLLLSKGVWSLIVAMENFKSLDIKDVFESTILLTLSLAIFDLVKAIFEEEVLGRGANENHRAVHKTMTRFLGSIIIAIAIEALMLVFKFTITQPDRLLYAVYLTGGVTMLLVGLSIYVKFAYGVSENHKRKNKY